MTKALFHGYFFLRQIAIHNLFNHDNNAECSDQTDLKRCNKSSPLHVAVWQQLQGGDVEAIVIITIRKVVNVISGHSVNTVIDCTLVGSFTCTSEIGFKGWSSCIKIGHNISVISPPFAKHFF